MSDELRTGVLELALGDTYIGSAYSPQVEVTDTEGGHEVAITYKDAETGITTKTFDVEDGATGPQGPAGFSPTVTITDTPTGYTVTITDAQGPHSYDVPNYAQEEQQRQDAWDALSREVTDAISDAETATSAASTAASSATSAAGAATTAAQAATTAAASANTAASSATSAATAANSAATAADTAADAATTAAGDATDAASAANTAAQAAQEAASEVAPEVAWLWGNQLTRELTGTILTAADAYAAPAMALTVEGKSTQASTTGKNLFSDATDTWANYTIVQDTYKYVEIDVPPSTQLTVSPTSTAAISGISGFNGYVVFWFDTTTFGNDHLRYPINAGTPVTLTFTSGENGKLRVGLVNTMTQEALDALWAKVKLQLEAGSTATSYEPYTGGKPSPSPDYPQEIVSVENPELWFAGKNLLDESLLLNASDWTVTNGVYRGTVVSLYKKQPLNSITPVAGPLTFSYDFRYVSDSALSPGNGIRFNFLYTDGTSESAPYTTRPTSFTRYTHHVPDGKVLRGIGMAYVLGGTIELRNMQLESGSTATAYQPYDGTSVPLQLTQPLRSLPDGTKDTLALTYLRPSTREGWAWYSVELVQRVGIVTFDGTQYWFISASGTYTRFGTSAVPTRVCRPIADKLTYYPLPQLLTQPYGIDAQATNRIYVSLDETITTEQQAKAWFVDNPVTVQYALATPITETLDPIELPVLPAPNVTVWADPSTGLTMEYVRDTNIVIANLEAAYADLATS